MTRRRRISSLKQSRGLTVETASRDMPRKLAAGYTVLAIVGSALVRPKPGFCHKAVAKAPPAAGLSSGEAFRTPQVCPPTTHAHGTCVESTPRFQTSSSRPSAPRPPRVAAEIVAFVLSTTLRSSPRRALSMSTSCRPF